MCIGYLPPLILQMFFAAGGIFPTVIARLLIKYRRNPEGPKAKRNTPCPLYLVLKKITEIILVILSLIYEIEMFEFLQPKYESVYCKKYSWDTNTFKILSEKKYLESRYRYLNRTEIYLPWQKKRDKVDKTCSAGYEMQCIVYFRWCRWCS